MAWAKLGRSRSKTLVTVLSLTLAVVLMNLVFTFADGFDMEKYLAGNVVTDFIFGHADQFMTSSGFRSADQALPEEVIADIEARGGITESGRVYGQEMSIQQLMPEDFLRLGYGKWYGGDMTDTLVDAAERVESGLLAGDAQNYGMEEFPLSRVNVLEGDLAPLMDPAQNAIAAIYRTDDYHALLEDSNWAAPGDTVTLRYVTRWGYIDLDMGEEISPEEAEARTARGEENYASRAMEYEEKDYTVCALVEMPTAISYRYYTLGGSQFILGAERFRQDSGMDSVMIYIFNTTEESNDAMEEFLADYTESVQPSYDYESRQQVVEKFEGFRNMFLIMGSVLAAIIGLVGVLTGILARKREFAVLQSVGMTGRQLGRMLVFEGLYYTMLSAALSLALSVAMGPLMKSICSVVWFFTYRLTVLPVLAVIPLFLILGTVTPFLMYRSLARITIVERLREAES